MVGNGCGKLTAYPVNMPERPILRRIHMNKSRCLWRGRVALCASLVSMALLGQSVAINACSQSPRSLKAPTLKYEKYKNRQMALR